MTLLPNFRDVPVSRAPGLSMNALAETIPANGFACRHLKALGNPKSDRDAGRLGDLETYYRMFDT